MLFNLLKKSAYIYLGTNIAIGGTIGIAFSSKDLYKLYKIKLNKCDNMVSIGCLHVITLVYSPFYFGRAIVVETTKFISHPIKHSNNILNNYHNYRIYDLENFTDF